MTPEGRKLDQFLSRSIKQFKRYPMAGGKFFALVDEMAASEERLDALAEPLLEKMHTSEKLAATAVEAKHAKLDAAIDYIKRLDGTVEKLGEDGNGGPKLPKAGADPEAKSGESTASPPPLPTSSDTQKQP